MIQNPSKYHPNPLSHFLSLHNSAANHLHHSSSHPNQPINHHQFSNADVTTSLDVGKSFTIAAILGLQKNAIENSQKELNNVMNLSLNNHHNHHQAHHHNQKGSVIASSNSSSSSNNNNNNHSALSVNSFDCDNLSAASVVQRYLPAAAAAAAVNGVTCATQSHFRLNHFGHHVGNGSSNGGQSALQSLQQLHQHHAQQVSLGFQNRDKVKSDHISNKKSSLKSKRVRTIFTPEQLERLEAEFERQQYMVGPERLYLAHTLQLTEAQVKVWFQNRRIKWRKHHLELTQQRLALIRQTQRPTTEDTNNPNCNSNPEQPAATHLHQSESDLSICNDSLDTESIHEGEDG